MDQYMRQIEHRIALKKSELLKKELERMDNDIANYEVKINNVKNIYDILLLKGEPVGSSIKLIRHIRNERNNCS
jgi:hypothetical protein